MLNYFYEKVVKVKADVAAIIIFLLLDFRKSIGRGLGGDHRGDAQGGGSAERFETLLRGEPRL